MVSSCRRKKGREGGRKKGRARGREGRAGEREGGREATMLYSTVTGHSAFSPAP
jgi:hypothetical protein